MEAMPSSFWISRDWLQTTNRCGIIVLFKRNQELLLDLADFALRERPEDNLTVTGSQPVWCNGSYTMAAKPIKSLIANHVAQYDGVNSKYYKIDAVRF